MSELDTHKSFNYMWSIWRFAGMFPHKNYKWLYYLYGIIINLVSSVTSPILAFLNVFFLFDIGLIIRTLQLSLYLFTVSIKQLMIFIRLPKLQKAKFYLNQLDERACVHKDDFKYLTTTVKQCRYITLTIQIAFMLSVIPYSLSSFVKRKLVFEGWLSPGLDSSSTHYIIVFVLQFLPIAFQLTQNTANDVFPPVSMNLLNGHTRVLCMRVARIGKDAKKSHDENYAELKSCINDHRNIISLFNTIKPTISQSVLIQLIITGAVLCLTVFYYLKFNHGEFGQLLGTIFDMLAILVVSFPVCYFGNSLMEETDRLTTAIYNCNWMDQTSKFQKTLIIFMQRSQRENVINAGGLITINLQTFTAILRFSFSMFTVLTQMSQGVIVSTGETD